MKKLLIWSLAGVAVLVAFFSLLSYEVSFQYGVDYKIYEKKIPLGIKLMEFICRDYHYYEITNEITESIEDDGRKIDGIYEYIKKRVKYQENMPVVDDHPYHILVRRYGVDDQFEDVFTILCNYAGCPAFYKKIDLFYKGRKIDFCSFVKIDGNWTVLSVFHGLIFKNKKGGYLKLNEIEKQWPEFEANSILVSPDFTRFKGQSFSHRILLEFWKIFK